MWDLCCTTPGLPSASNQCRSLKLPGDGDNSCGSGTTGTAPQFQQPRRGCLTPGLGRNEAGAEFDADFPPCARSGCSRLSRGEGWARAGSGSAASSPAPSLATTSFCQSV